MDKLAARIDFEAFRPLLSELAPSAVSAKGGRPPPDPVLMFKVLVLQHYYALSAERVELLRYTGVENCIQEKGARNRTLTEAQKRANRSRSQMRARVEPEIQCKSPKRAIHRSAGTHRTGDAFAAGRI